MLQHHSAYFNRSIFNICSLFRVPKNPRLSLSWHWETEPNWGYCYIFERQSYVDRNWFSAVKLYGAKQAICKLGHRWEGVKSALWSRCWQIIIYYKTHVLLPLYNMSQVSSSYSTYIFITMYMTAVFCTPVVSNSCILLLSSLPQRQCSNYLVILCFISFRDKNLQ